MENAFIAAKDQGRDSIAMYDIRKLRRSCETSGDNIVQRVSTNLVPAPPDLTIAPVRYKDYWQERNNKVRPHGYYLRSNRCVKSL